MRDADRFNRLFTLDHTFVLHRDVRPVSTAQIDTRTMHTAEAVCTREIRSAMFFAAESKWCIPAQQIWQNQKGSRKRRLCR